MSEIRKNHTKDILLGLFITVVGGIIVVKYEHNAFDDKKNEGQVATINQLGKKDVSTPVDIKSGTV